MTLSFEEKLRQILTENQIFVQEPMSGHTTFRVGGPADYYLRPGAGQAAPVLSLCRSEQLPVTVIGNGSNLLVSDRGIRGVVVEIGARASEAVAEGNLLKVQAGISLAKAARAAANASLSGLEFASGIPGTAGGAIVMNAGAYGGEIKDVLKWARVLLPDGRIEKYTPQQLELSYRHSVLPEWGGVVLEASFLLEPGDREQIEAQMEEYRRRRNEKQPLEYPSAGSTFKRPEGYFAGKLIMEAGLSGFRVGGAQVSEKHCGFVINRDHATASEIVRLIEEVQRRVEERFGVRLEPEVKRVGEF